MNVLGIAAVFSDPMRGNKTAGYACRVVEGARPACTGVELEVWRRCAVDSFHTGKPTLGQTDDLVELVFASRLARLRTRAFSYAPTALFASAGQPSKTELAFPRIMHQSL